MTLRDEYVQALEAEIDALQARIAEIETLLGARVDCPLALDFTALETQMFGLLIKRDLVTKDAAMTVLYGGRQDKEVPEPKIVDVWVCKMRRKLKPFGISIGTKWGQGWYFDAESKARAVALLPARSAA